MDPSLANHLYEYRMEIMHIFKFDQLLKIKGISKETIQQWVEPETSASFNPDLQESLGISTDTPASVSQLLEAICKMTNASARLLTVLNGKIQVEYATDQTSLSYLAPGIFESTRHIQEDILQTNLVPTDLQIIGFESHDVLLVSAGAFYIMSVFPSGKLHSTTLSLWKSLATEIKNRYPPRLYVENHAISRENDIAFDCPTCHLRLLIDRVGIGYSFPCPRCKTQLIVPSQTTSHSSYIQAEKSSSTATVAS